VLVGTVGPRVTESQDATRGRTRRELMRTRRNGRKKIGKEEMMVVMGGSTRERNGDPINPEEIATTVDMESKPSMAHTTCFATKVADGT